MAEKTFADHLENSEPVEAPEVETEAPAKAEQPRDETGKFAKKGEEEEGAPPASASEFDGAATIAERRKRQEAEDRARDAQERLEALERRIQEQQNPPPAPPDIWEDPDGRLAFERNQLQEQFRQELWQQRYNTSLWRAEQQHGKEVVEQAVNWAAERQKVDPQFLHAAFSQMDPVGFAIEMHRREQMASVNHEDFEAFQQRKAQQTQQVQQPASAQAPPTLTGERNLGKRQGPASTGPSTFGEILNR